MDGPGAGGRLLEVRTPPGLCADIALDRGGDLLRLAWKGREIGWHSAAMAPNPWPDAEAEHGLGFLRGFDGFLVTCGLDHHGVPAETPAARANYPLRDVHVHPLHGRIAGCRAELVAKRIDWDAGAIAVELVIRQATVFGETLELHRHYAFALGGGQVTVTDTVTNRGFRPARHGLLYHFNVGYPMLSGRARLNGKGWALSDRLNADAKPADDHVEVVEAGPSPREGGIGITGAGIALFIRFDPAALPITALWRAFQSGTFALGLEPQTDLTDPAASTLAPGEARHYAMTLIVEDAPDDPVP